MNIKLPNGKYLRVDIGIMNRPYYKTWGLLNRTPDNYYLPFFDYDHVNMSVIEDEVDYLQTNFDVGPLLVRESSPSYKTETGETIGSYHLFGFSKFTLPEFRTILEHSRSDWGFKQGFKWEPERAWVLRVGSRTDPNGKVIAGTKYSKLYMSKTKRTLYRPLVTFFSLYDDSIDYSSLLKFRCKWDTKNTLIYQIKYEGSKKRLVST